MAVVHLRVDTCPSRTSQKSWKPSRRHTESLGGVESLIAHPATMTHAGMGEEARRAAGITDGLLRLSVGLEAEADLIAGLQCGLAAVEQAQGA
jgi:cystathionine beta-lyase/cystathionine gamma-synthase